MRRERVIELWLAGFVLVAGLIVVIVLLGTAAADGPPMSERADLSFSPIHNLLPTDNAYAFGHLGVVGNITKRNNFEVDPHCNEKDGCYPYGDGCEERDYYCMGNETGCNYTSSNRHNDSWVDTGNTRWVDENECQEKEQKEQEYRDYKCSARSCKYSINDTKWIDTGICNSTCNYVSLAPPEITSFTPLSYVDDTVGNWRTFDVTANQAVNVSWYLNNTLVLTNESVLEAKCTLLAEVVGEHNVTAIASNANGSDMQTWTWDVTELELPKECEGTDTCCGIYPNCGNCNEKDGCYPYGDGCEERDYYCMGNETGCNYTSSNRHNDSWVDTGNMRWVDENECEEKEQKEQEYRDYECSAGSCNYSINDTKWLDTGNTSIKANGTICGCTANNTVKRCYDGNCTDAGIGNSSNCCADVACDGKKPGESCGDGRICNSTCNCVSLAPPGITSFAPLSYVDDTVCNWRTFNVTINQAANVSWYLNNMLVLTNEGVREAKCMLLADVVGEHNVTAIASNANGSDMQTWIWDVTELELPKECEGTDTCCGIYPNCGNCNEKDGCYPYGDGCEERDYYCMGNGAGCNYTSSNRHNDSWVDTGNTRWVDVNKCEEKEQKEQEYRDYECSAGSGNYRINNTKWIDTGNRSTNANGTICGCTANNTVKRCYDGNCTDTGIGNSSNCCADVHDLAVTNVATIPTMPTVGQSTAVCVTVTNERTQQEDNVSVKAFVDGAQVGLTKYVSLDPGSSDTLTFLWIPHAAKNYSVEGEVGIVDDEADTGNNTKAIEVGVLAMPAPVTTPTLQPSQSAHTGGTAPPKENCKPAHGPSGDKPTITPDIETVPVSPLLSKQLLFINDGTWSSITNTDWDGYFLMAAMLQAKGFTVEEQNLNPITLEDLASYDVVVFSPSWKSREINPSEAEALAIFVQNGGGLFLMGELGVADWSDEWDNSVSKVGNYFGIEFEFVMVCDPTDHYYHADDPDEGVDQPFITDIRPHDITDGISNFILNWGTSLQISAPAIAIAYTDSDAWLDTNSIWHSELWHWECHQDEFEAVGSFPVLAISQYGSGKVVAIGDPSLFFNCWLDYYDHDELAQNVFEWLSEENQPPTCAIELRKDGAEIDEIDVGEFFDIYAGDSTDDTGINEVRFSSDDSQDGIPAGEWTVCYDWDTSSGDWDAETKIKKWSFDTGGAKEVWADVKDEAGQTSKCSANIYANSLIPQSYAIIVAGQADWRQKSAIDHSANNAYRVLRNLGFDDDHIFYLNDESQQIDGQTVVDKPASLDNLKNSIDEIKHKIGDSPTPLILYLVGHGIKEVFDFYTESDALSSTDLRLMLEPFQDNLMLIVIGSCYSGSFITLDQVTDSISGNNRIIITATHDDEERYSILGLGGWYHSSDRFWGNLNKGLNVKDAFITNAWPGDRKHLWLDDNGDNIGHPPDNLGNDGALASATTIGVPGTDDLELTSWYSVWIHSAGELRVYDSQNHVTGLVNGEVKEEIPDSIYDEQNEVVVIFSPSDTYHYEVAGTDEGTYGLDIASIEEVNAITFTATNVTTSTNAAHQYTIDWDALAQGEKGVTIQIDSDGDGTFEQNITTDDTFQPPIASFFPTTPSPVVSEEITFNAASSYDPDGTITKYEWNFGDGSTMDTTEPIITHSYASIGEYTVNLTVTDDDGATGTNTTTITVLNPPDLVITEKWLCWPDNCTICYNVTNIGKGTAHAGHNTTLYVDDVAVAHDHVPVDLAPGESYIGCFDGYVWTYTPPSDDITVCADNNESLNELDEDNNCLINIWICGDVNGDEVVDMSDVIDLLYYVGYPGQYTICNEWAADVNCDKAIDMSDVIDLLYYVGYPGQYELKCCCL